MITLQQYLYQRILRICHPWVIYACTGNCLTEIIISIDDAWDHEMLSLNPSKSSSPDRFHPRVLREVREGIITHINFKKSLEEGKVPTAWKDASVTALHKMEIKVLHLTIGQLV